MYTGAKFRMQESHALLGIFALEARGGVALNIVVVIGESVRKFLPVVLSLSVVLGVATQANAADDLSQGKRLLQRHNYAAAIESLQKAVTSDPKSFSAELALARAYFGAKKFRESLPHFSRAIEMHDGSGKHTLTALRMERAEAEHFAGDYQGAVADLTWIIEHGTATEKTYLQRASANDALNQQQLAVADLSKRSELAPKQAEIFLHRALLYKTLKENDAALADFAKAIKLNPAL